MAKAQNLKTGAHARIFKSWLDLPACRALSSGAFRLLVNIMARSRPNTENGRLAISARLAGEWLGMDFSSASRFLTELVDNGWLDLERMTKFENTGVVSLYALTMFPNVVTGEDETFRFAYEIPAAKPPRKSRAKSTKGVAAVQLDRCTPTTSQLQLCNATVGKSGEKMEAKNSENVIGFNAVKAFSK